MKASHSQPLNPFPGLRPFRSDEHHLFFGREDQTTALLQLLRQNRFLAVVGTSGSGKSSLVRAGMIAELHGGTMTHAGSTWEVMILRPGGSPIENLARAMVEADLYDAEDTNSLPRLLATLRRSRFGLVEAMKQSDVFEPGTNLLVVVDQFEELFRFRQSGIESEEAATAFVNLLLTATQQAECPIYVTITMRSDYLGDCSEIPGLAEAVNEGEYLIPRLMRDQKRDAIEKPIGVGGAKISPLLVQRLLNDVGDDPDQLPVLQHALMRMWEVWSAGSDHSLPIDFSDFEATGGLASALSNHADEIYDSLPDDSHRVACEKIFKTLTEKGDDNRGIRRPTRLSMLQEVAGVDRACVTTVLDAFRQSGVTFLMPGSELELTDRTVLDLSHESLMRGWQRLRSWVEDEAQSARIFRRVLDTARLWNDGKAGLFRDPDLQIALSWREEEQPNNKWAAQYGGDFETAIGFLESSNADAEAERQAKEASRQRELEQARELAEAQQLRLGLQQRAARKLRKMIGGLAVVAIVAVCACVAALVSNRRANDLAVVAQQKSEIAEASAADADRERKNAERALAQVAAQKSEVVSSLSTAEDAERSARAAIDNFLVKVSENQLLSTPGLQPLRAELLDSASRFYEDFLAKNPNNRELQAGLADAFYRVGFVNNELGNQAQALQALEKSIALWESALKINPADPAFRHGLAAAWYEVGRAKYDLSNAQDQSGLYEAARNAARMWTALAADYPQHVDYKKSLARAFNLMGLAGSNNPQDQERSFLAYQQSLQIRLELLPDHPDDVELLHGLGESFNNLGTMVADGEHRLFMLQRSIEFNVEVCQLRPQNVEYALDLGIGYSVTGSQLNDMNRIPEALASYRQGVEHMLAFIQANPAVPAMRDLLGTTLARIRTLNIPPDQADEYAQIFQQVRDTFARMPRKTTDDHFFFAQVQSDGATQFYRAHHTVQKRELTAEEEEEIASMRSGALESLRLAVAADFRDPQRLMQDPLLADARMQPEFNEIAASLEAANSSGTVVAEATVAALPTGNDLIRLEQDRATSYLTFGMIETRFHRNKQARKSLEHALSLRQTLADVEPANEQRQAELNVAQSVMAKLLWNEGRLADALKLFNQRTVLLEQALQQAPHDKALEVSLAAHHRSMADALAETALWEEAVPHYVAALDLEKSAQNPNYEPVMAEILAPAMQLLIEDDDAYRAGCAQILEKYGEDASGETAVRLARLYALRPIAGDNIARIVALAEKAKYHWHVYTNALVLFRAGRFEDAVRIIEEANRLKTYTGMPQDQFVLAMAYFQLGQRDQARKVLEAVNLLSLRSMDGGWHSASALLDADWIVLRREANELIYGSPYSSGDRMRRGRAFAQLGDLEKSATEFAAVVEASADYPLAHFAFARALAEAGRREKAEHILEKARQLFDGQQTKVTVGDVECWRLLGETLSLLDRHEEASQVFRHAFSAQSLKVFNPRPLQVDRELLLDLHLRLTDELQSAARPEEASKVGSELALLLKVLGVPPLIRNAADLLVVEPTESRNHSASISGIDQLLATNEKSRANNDPIRWHLSARLHQRRADVLREGGRNGEIAADLSAARNAWELILNSDPQDADVARNLADLLLMESNDKWTILKPTQLLLDQHEHGNSTRWTVLKPFEVNSKSGVALAVQNDQSLLVTGNYAVKDVYSVDVREVPPGVQAIRLEALCDDRLPGGGPGTYGGQFVLSNFKVFHPDETETSGLKQISLRSACATFEERPAQQSLEIGESGWSIWGGQGRSQSACFAVERDDVSSTSDRLRFLLDFYHVTADGTAATLGRFRLSVSNDPSAFEYETRRCAALKLTDPWAKLAATYHLIGDQPALDKLLKRHPAAAAGIGDLYAADKNWDRAIVEYSKLITAESTDAAVLTKRAAAYIATENWDLAQADWRRVVTQQPDQIQSAFDQLLKAKRWNEATEFGLKLIEQNPEDTLVWLRIAPVLVLAEDQVAYAEFCGRMAQQFAESKLPEDPERVIKASLLRANSVDLAKLPADMFAKSLDDGTVPDWLPPWGWGTRALLACRSGDAESAVKYVDKSEEFKPAEPAHALNLAVRAMAQQKLQHPDEARTALDDASQLITRLKEDPARKGDHDLLIAEILLHEAEALINGKEEPKESGSKEK